MLMSWGTPNGYPRFSIQKTRVLFRTLSIARDYINSKLLIGLEGGQVGYLLICEMGTAVRASGFRHSWTQGMGSLLSRSPVKAMIGPALVISAHSARGEFSDWLDLGHISTLLPEDGVNPN